MKDKNIIDAIHEKDLEAFLINLSLFENFKNNLINCVYCKNPVNFENICAITINNGKIEFICNNDACNEKLLNYQRGARDV